MSTLAISTQNVCKSFPSGENQIHVLREISLEARVGEITMLVGPSGCGKTTLLSAIAGTLRIDSGEISVFGQPLHNQSDAALTRWRAKHIGFIFQQFQLIPTLTIAENVSIPLLIQGHSNRHALAKAREQLALVDLADRAHERPNKLSGGQQQRVAIARALIHQPPLVICDEPTAALDAKNGEVVMNLFHEIAQSQDRAVLIVTHDNRIFSYANRIATMDDGQITAVHQQPVTNPSFAHEPLH